MTQTSSTIGLPTVPSGVDIYDALMGKIDSELLSVNLPHLDEKYENETPDQRAIRYKRYEQAYAKYDKAYAQWLADFGVLVSSLKRTALRSAEAEDRKAEEAQLKNMESKMS